MKILLLSISLALATFFGFGNNMISSDSDATVKEAIIYQKGDKTVLYAEGSNEFIILQTENALLLEKPILITQSKSEEVVLNTGSGKNIQRLSVGKNIIGISILRGQAYTDKMVTRTKIGIEFNTVEVDDIVARSCGCRSNGTSTRGCSSGGDGASECSLSGDADINVGPLGGGAGTSCTVKCRDTHYACCEED